MKTLRLVLTALVLVAACDAPGPSAPEHPANSVLNNPTPENSPPCDSACKRSPMLGGGVG